MKHINLVILFLLLCTFVHAQVSVRYNVDRDNILIGESIELTVEAYVPLGAEVLWFGSDTLPHFDILHRSQIDTVQNIDGKKISQKFRITSFDSGQQYLPPVDIVVDGQHYYTDSVMINVSFTPFDPKEDYRDIKDIIEIKNPSVKYIPLILSVLALLALITTGIFLRRRRFESSVVRKVIKPLESPFEEAMKALAQLSSKNISNGEAKQYYSEMNDILRRYVLRKFSVSTFERTNEELIIELSKLGIPKDSFISLTQSLRMSDFVKFAKYRPSEDDNRKNLKIVTSSIEILDKSVGSAV